MNESIIIKKINEGMDSIHAFDIKVAPAITFPIFLLELNAFQFPCWKRKKEKTIGGFEAGWWCLSCATFWTHLGMSIMSNPIRYVVTEKKKKDSLFG